jgi:FlaA1/EpsC-like NDP-sugar epimerase
MTIPEALQLVIKAGSLGEQGETFALDMGDPVKIMDLAKEMIKHAGSVPSTLFATLREFRSR